MKSLLKSMFLFFMVACQSPAPQEKLLEVKDDTQEILEQKINQKYAQNFSLSYQNNYKILSIFRASPQSQDTLRFVLLQRNTPAPAGFKKEQIIEVPIRKICTTSTTQIAQLDTLGLLDKIVGVSDLAFISEEKILKKIEQKTVFAVGVEGRLQTESLIESGTDLVLFNSFSEQEKNQIAQFEKFGIKALPITDWLEQHPLGRTEWLKVLAALFNEEKKAENIFEKISQEYEKIRDLAQANNPKPSVFRGLPYKNTWYVAGGKSYIAQLLADAGADYVWKNDQQTGSISLDFEAVYPVAVKADIWLIMGNINSQKELLALDQRFEKFAAYKNNAIFSDNKKLNAKGESDYYTKGVNNPHLVLADLVKIFYPQSLPHYQSTYFKALAQ